MAIVLAALWYFASLPDKALDRADRLGSVGSMITGLLALLVVLVSVRMAVQPHTASAPKDVIEPKRVWNAPIRNRMFLGREELLKSLSRQLRTGGSAVIQALHGMGGVGKTQIALEYAHRYANDYDLVWWFASEKTELIGDQYLTLEHVSVG